MCQYPFYSLIQGPKLHLPGRQCDKDLSTGDQNFRCGRQQATNIVTADYYVQRKRLRIKFPDICQQALKFCSVDIFKMKLKRVSRQLLSLIKTNENMLPSHHVLVFCFSNRMAEICYFGDQKLVLSRQLAPLQKCSFFFMQVVLSAVLHPRNY